MISRISRIPTRSAARVLDALKTNGVIEVLREGKGKGKVPAIINFPALLSIVE